MMSMHDFDETSTAFTDSVSSLLYTFYSKLMAEGFNDEQAMYFVVMYFQSLLNFPFPEEKENE